MNTLGWAIDYADIKEAFGPVYTILDHHNLDETAGVNAGSPLEFLQWIWTKTSSELPILVRIDLFETPERGVVCTGSLDSPACCQRRLWLHMTYSVKEIFPTLQGEGAQSGRAAVCLQV